MKNSDTPSQADFRARAREWIERYAHESPPPLRGVHIDDPRPYRKWQSRLAEARLVGVAWPVEFGGAGLTAVEEMIVTEELARCGCATIVDHVAIGDLGPTMISHGTEAQKSRYLAPMLQGQEGWCQLFSEPAAGSDLAGVTTRAERTATGWRINGQKVWTTLAHAADFGMLLARTDPDAPKHRGLTMFIVDMKARGVRVRPLRLMSGAEPFNEVFFDDVEIEADAVVGDVNDGWTVATTTLMYERVMALGALQHLAPDPAELLVDVVDLPETLEPGVQSTIAHLAVDQLSLRFALYRALLQMKEGAIPGPEAGLGKLSAIEAGRRGAALVVELLGPDALCGEWGAVAAEMPGLRSAGGTDEILRNLIADRVLGLPREPRLDTGARSSLAGRGVA
jgi:alkylation response protein AidB-like acyl-CoA dehydrogenase